MGSVRVYRVCPDVKKNNLDNSINNICEDIDIENLINEN